MCRIHCRARFARLKSILATATSPSPHRCRQACGSLSNPAPVAEVRQRSLPPRRSHACTMNVHALSSASSPSSPASFCHLRLWHLSYTSLPAGPTAPLAALRCRPGLNSWISSPTGARFTLRRIFAFFLRVLAGNRSGCRSMLQTCPWWCCPSCPFTRLSLLLLISMLCYALMLSGYTRSATCANAFSLSILPATTCFCAVDVRLSTLFLLNPFSYFCHVSPCVAVCFGQVWAMLLPQSFTPSHISLLPQARAVGLPPMSTLVLGALLLASPPLPCLRHLPVPVGSSPCLLILPPSAFMRDRPPYGA
jgi:hypothetical protein